MRKIIQQTNVLILGLIFLSSCSSTNSNSHSNPAVNTMISDGSDTEMVMLTKTLERLALSIDSKLNKATGRLAPNVKSSWEEARIEILRASTRVEQWANSQIDPLTSELIIYLKKAMDKLAKALETYPNNSTSNP